MRKLRSALRPREISDAWLADRRAAEKGFSLGVFDPAVITQGRVGLMRRNGRVVAFITLLETDCAEEAAVDLMRFAGDFSEV